MGDLEFIESKVVAGDYFQVSGDIDNVNDTIEFIVPNGKTAFLIEAKIVITRHVDAATASAANFQSNNAVEADFKVDGAVKDTTNLGIMSENQTTGTAGRATSNAYGNIGDGRFNVLGLSLVGDGAKKIEIENTLDDGTAFATMSGYVITT